MATSTAKTLTVKHTVSYKADPLLSLRNLPSFDAEITPAHARCLAAAILAAADDCEALREQTRWYGPERREYLLDGA